MTSVSEIRKAQRAEGPATVLAIGTANPPLCIQQSDYPDYYFKMTHSEHKTDLKKKFQRICDKTMIKQRHFHMTEDIVKENPSILDYEHSLGARQEMLVVETPKLAKEAALKALKEWGQPKSKITHLVFCTYSGTDMPGADYQLVKLLGLQSNVKRSMMYLLGCYGGGTVLRVAKDLAENNKGARVLAVCCELTAIAFSSPSEDHMDNLIGQAIFGDGAGAVIVGSDPIPEIEKPIFELVWAGQSIASNSEGAILGRLHEVGLTYLIRKDVPVIVSNNVESVMTEAFKPLGITDYNSLFWICHPGGPAIVKEIEKKLELKPEKLKSTWEVLSEYGNMSSVCVMFILDRMRKNSMKGGFKTTGEGLNWGVMLSFGPGLSVETLVLHSVAI